MPDRLTSRTVLAVLLILLTIAGIRAASPAVGAHFAATPVLIATGCALEAVLAGLLIALRRGLRPAAGPHPATLGPAAGPAARLRPMLSRAIQMLLVVVPLATLIGIIVRSHWHLRLRGRRGLAEHGAGRTHKFRFGGHHLVVLGANPRYVIIALLMAAIIIAAILIWRRRRRWSRAGRFDIPADDDTSTPADLARAVDSGRLALHELDDARTAIIRCYLAMEESLAEAGAARAAAETPDELLSRAFDAGLVPDLPARRLTALFYEARFSTHPMPLVRRDEAEQALAELAAALPPQAEHATTADPA